MSADAHRPPLLRRILPLLLIAVASCAYGGYRLYLARLPYEWSGTVESRTISVGSRAGGRVARVLVREGDHVPSGTAIIELEAGDWPAQLLEAEGDLDQMRANLERVEHGARPEEIEVAAARTRAASAAADEMRTGARPEVIAAARARVAAQDTAVVKAQLDVDRTRKLAQLGTGAVSQANVDADEAALRGAIATRDALHEALRELEAGSRKEDVAQADARAAEAAASEKLVRAGSRAEDVALAHAQVKAAQGRVDRIRVMVDELTIRAPRDARVEACDLRPGDILGPNATAATLLEEGQLYIRIYVPETRIGLVHPGDVVPITVDSFPGRSFEGVVEHVNDVGEFSPRNLQTADERADQVFGVRLGLRSGKDELRAGMAAFIQVPK